jgi:hypothetical protein
MGRFLAREIKWFLAALLLSAPLSGLYWLLLLTVDTPDGAPRRLGFPTFLAGWGVLLACLYVGRAVVRFLRDAFVD